MMLFSAAVDTAIGLLFVYLTLSLMCTGINEAIAGLFRLRARNLFNEVSRALGDKALQNAFWKHGLIRGLARGPGVMRTVDPPAPVPQVTSGKAPSYLESQNFAIALMAAMRSIENLDRATKFDISSPLNDTLTALGIDASSAIKNTEQALMEWFDQLMDRASGVYKRWMSMLTFLVAITISVAINADTMQIARTLWQDDAVRTVVVEAATRVTVADINGVPDLSELEDTLPLPLGWSMQDPGDGDMLAVLSKVVGLLLTAFALSLGAPFWFDLLSRFVSLRNSGPPVATSRR